MPLLYCLGISFTTDMESDLSDLTYVSDNLSKFQNSEVVHKSVYKKNINFDLATLSIFIGKYRVMW